MEKEQKPRFEVADVVRQHGKEYCELYHPSKEQRAVLRHIEKCRTAELGGHVEQCDSCGEMRISYNSCRDRHCPKCQATARTQWITERMERLLPVDYFHVVFTIPHELCDLALRNKKLLFDILFSTASKSLSIIGRDEKHLGAQMGFSMVLHTWGQNLLFHPHIHSVVTGGGLSPDLTQWIPARKGYLLPVKVLGRLFRGKFLDALDKAYENGQLDLAGNNAELINRQAWCEFKDKLYEKDWVVYSKQPFGGPEQVFKYLGRYTHRVAISNNRIVDFKDGRVTFSWKDYGDNGKTKLMTIDALEFLRRFLLHVLPSGYIRIRHYGICASTNVNSKLEIARVLLEPKRDTTEPDAPESTDAEPLNWWERFFEQTGIDIMACPFCGRGRMIAGPMIGAEMHVKMQHHDKVDNMNTS